jgi:hypothetical protein
MREPASEPEPRTRAQRELLSAVFAIWYHLTAAVSAASALLGGAQPSAEEAGDEWVAREALAAASGRRIRVLLAAGGPSTGTFGREQQLLRSRVWVCFRNRNGVALSPVVVSLHWTSLHAIASHGRIASTAAITIGWPSQREARVCVEAAGCAWPDALLR